MQSAESKSAAMSENTDYTKQERVERRESKTTPALQKAVDEYAEEKIKDIQSRAYEAVMKERNDIATRATYLCLLACYQAGLSRRTLVKIQNYMTGPVADKYNEYRNDQLADLWAQVTLQGIGIDAKKTEEPL